MKKNHDVPPLGAAVDYLLTASPAMLQSFELLRLNDSANLKKLLAETIKQTVDATAEALLARTLIEHRKKIRQSANGSNPVTSADLLAELLVSAKRIGNGKERT